MAIGLAVHSRGWTPFGLEALRRRPERIGCFRGRRKALAVNRRQFSPSIDRPLLNSSMNVSAVPRSSQTGHDLGPSEPLIELADGQQASVGADEPAVRIGDDGFTRVEVEVKLLSTVCHARAPLPRGSQASRARILQGFGGLCYAQTARIHE